MKNNSKTSNNKHLSKSQKTTICRKSGFAGAFTLAETLMALAVIGIVAVLTLPAMLEQLGDYTLQKQKEVFTKKFAEGLRQMRVDDKLSEKYATTADFVNAMKEYFKISAVCDNNNLTGCFPENISFSVGEKIITKDTATLKTAKDINSKVDYKTSDVIGIRFSDGNAVLITYNPSCPGIEAGNTTADVHLCFGYIADVNGNKSPNTKGQDIISNIDFDEEKYGSEISYSPLSQTECNSFREQHPDLIHVCEIDNDYWAGAVKACYDMGKRLPTTTELTTLASELYGRDCPDSADVHCYAASGVQASANPLWDNIGLSEQSVLWSSIETDGTTACFRSFGPGSSHYGYNPRSQNIFGAICVK